MASGDLLFSNNTTNERKVILLDGQLGAASSRWVQTDDFIYKTLSFTGLETGGSLKIFYSIDTPATIDTGGIELVSHPIENVNLGPQGGAVINNCFPSMRIEKIPGSTPTPTTVLLVMQRNHG